MADLPTLRAALRAAARPAAAPVLHRFFKTGPGEYAAGDRFLGVRVPDTRRLVRESDPLTENDLLSLLRSPLHEERLLALLILVRRYERRPAARPELVALYLREIEHVNNWDLVDSSAPYLLGPWLLDRDRSLLPRLAASPSLWERRIAILATLAFIRAGQFADTLALATQLRDDPHDLLHKAVGWMLREVGQRHPAALRAFLDSHAAAMPRTTLRYAIEKFPAPERAAWLARRKNARESRKAGK